jgi:hypothetical protein
MVAAVPIHIGVCNLAILSSFVAVGAAIRDHERKLNG